MEGWTYSLERWWSHGLMPGDECIHLFALEHPALTGVDDTQAVCTGDRRMSLHGGDAMRYSGA